MKDDPMSESRDRPGPRLTLFQRMLGFILLALVAVSTAQVFYTEHVLEGVMMDQLKQRAVVFLGGLERELQGKPSSDSKALRALLLEAKAVDPARLGFAINSLYIFDPKGRILAHTEPGEHPPKPMAGTYYEQVIRTNEPYLGAEVEYDGEGPARTPKTDVIIPLVLNGQPAGGLELELDLQRTATYIKALDNRYESHVMLMVAGASSLLMLLFWWVLKRGLVNPLKRLDATTRRIAEGDLDARVAPVGQDEVGSLARSVNTMADSLRRLFDEQEQAYLGTLQALAKALEAKDAYTASHSGRVSRYSVRLGRRVGLPADQLALLKQGALVHDIGKIGIPDAILNKPSALTDEEYDIMRTHPELTSAIMRPLKRFKAFADIARWHHERWDGNGYPDGLAGEEIPLLARIVALADTWDAMTGDRVYRQGMPEAKALAILERERDSGQWDPHLVDLFVAMVRAGRPVRDGTGVGSPAGLPARPGNGSILETKGASW